MTTPDALYSDLQVACIAVFERHGISGVNVKVEALISFTQARNARIRQEFFAACPEKREAIYCELEARYGLKRNTIEDIVRGER